MRVANDVEVRVQVYCRNLLVLLLLECTLFVVVIMMLVECFTSLSPASDLVIKLKCTPSYDGRLPEHWQYGYILWAKPEDQQPGWEKSHIVAKEGNMYRRRMMESTLIQARIGGEDDRMPGTMNVDTT